MLLAQDALTLIQLGQLIAQIGVPAGLVLFFVWEGREREKRVAAESRERESRMVARIDNLEDFQRNQLVEINTKTTAALLEDAASSRATTVVLSELKRDLEAHHKLAIEIDKKLPKP